AIRKWVLNGDWRNADYVLEPGRGPANGFVDRYAGALENIAADDEEFTEK
ncbi:hypothetical protein AJ80_10094, partial [Polytolypa hystricis UAMH7299]